MRKVRKQSNIEPLNTAGKQHMHFQMRQEQYSRWIHWRRRGIAVIAMLIITVLAMINLYGQQTKYTNASAGLQQTNKALINAKQNNADLKQEVQDLHDDSYLQKLIREKYMYTKDNEIVFNMPN
ncbi:FtsB family cell division protein [Weissella sagaensis]|jgi:cell division protein DivIC|uniref:Septum formation initiator family protein n=1 Tax=Weissella sagaensis TaxID=2559928 RepID=A0ABW1RR98_9LACO|nr:septum formation initiator family protein [Weissella sagaensis]KAA8434868.1 septum formation initiator family protein [Weissella paramesenteroides]MBU7568783.1 septum formation initiator family protein [Weissella hellenica]KAA8436824.1 septum formation initiator family protein [Weissella paramesenteroides]QEA57073.1 septum formation initiator family protein [Weissella hellenica]UEG66184.1 septum formation initiator family protein [Weissella hellenica]